MMGWQRIENISSVCVVGADTEKMARSMNYSLFVLLDNKELLLKCVIFGILVCILHPNFC